jgi:hypothetical protein
MDEERATVKQIAYINRLMSEIAEVRPFSPLTFSIEEGAQMKKEEASVIIEFLHNAMDGTWKQEESEKIEEKLRAAWKVVDRALPEDAGTDVKADVAGRVGIVLYLKARG